MNLLDVFTSNPQILIDYPILSNCVNINDIHQYNKSRAELRFASTGSNIIGKTCVCIDILNEIASTSHGDSTSNDFLTHGVPYGNSKLLSFVTRTDEVLKNVLSSSQTDVRVKEYIISIVLKDNKNINLMDYLLQINRDDLKILSRSRVLTETTRTEILYALLLTYKTAYKYNPCSIDTNFNFDLVQYSEHHTFNINLLERCIKEDDVCYILDYCFYNLKRFPTNYFPDLLKWVDESNYQKYESKFKEQESCINKKRFNEMKLVLEIRKKMLDL